MKILSKINIKSLFLLLALSGVIFLVQCGLTALTIEMPSSANAGEEVTFVLRSGTEPRIDNNAEDPTYTTKLIVGFLAPKSWRAAGNTVVSFTSPKGSGAMERIPAAERESTSGLLWPDAAKQRFGIGPNLLDDMEWVVYRSNSNFTFVNNEDVDFEVKVKSKIGTDNMLVKLGFFVNASKEGLRSDDVEYTKYAYSDVFTVHNGEGDLVDFVNPQLSKIDPVKSLDNDIITLTFDAGVIETTLSGNDDLYLCIKAITANNETIEICEQSSKTKLTPIGNKKYRIDLWPRGYFSVDKDQTIVRLEYFYTNATGSERVGYGNTTSPFTFSFICE